jgi:hypothetical protein
MAKEEAGASYVDCDNLEGAKRPNELCRLDSTKFGAHCSKDNKFGYDKGKPCIFIKLNKVRPLRLSKVPKQNSPFFRF